MTEIKRTTKLAWRRFLQSEPGMEGMLFLREKLPSVIKGQQHEIVFDAGVTQGYGKCLDNISEILAVEDKAPQKPDND